ncbi:bck1-like resistance to osmotic shock [Thoreauomyces humboldtii]|nr:bck1-like resistance to osmotic shock [Thoreauomyces humboldtii]
MSQSPLLHIPAKRTDEADLTASFRNYIASVYQDDPDKYALEIATLYRLRQDTRGAGKDITGRDILYRYYGQLELLDLRFPVDEKHVKVLFTWYDAFSQKPTAQYSIAYEKACIIFNIAATCSSIGALQNRFESSGLKMAFNYFQAAAGLFLYINDNFLHAPSLDLSRDSIKTLHDLMLGQAQECFLEKVLLEKKTGALVAKLAAQAAHVYQSVVDGFSNESIRAQIDKAWIELTKVKVKYFQALAMYHKSMQSEASGKYGENVAYLTSAELTAKEANKLATAFAGSYPSFTVSAIAATNTSAQKGHATAASAALLEATVTNLNVITERKKVAIRDNDMIYHDSVPKVETLSPVEKMNAVKPTSFADICANGQADIPKIIGADIFQKLVPLAVHESASLYSEEKAKLLRAEQERVDNANGELQASLESMNLVATLDKLKRLSKSPGSRNETITVPEEARRWCEEVRASENAGTRTDELLELLAGFKIKVKQILDELSLSLDKEQHDCETYRAKFGELWRQEPSAKLTAKMREDIRQHRDSFEKANATDGLHEAGLKDSQANIDILRREPNEVHAALVELVTSAPSKRGSQVANLIDGADDNSGGFGVLNEQIMIEKMDGLLVRLRALKKERTDLVEELKSTLHNDDISSLLLLNKGKDAQVFQAELSKFKPIQGRLTANLHAHEQFLRDLGADFTKLEASSESIKAIDATERRKTAVLKDWGRSFEQWKQVKDGLTRGIQFYTGLGDLVESLRSEVTRFVNERAAEREPLAKQLEDDEATRRQNTLREQLQRLNVASPVQSPTYSAPESILQQPPSPVYNHQQQVHSPSEVAPPISHAYQQPPQQTGSRTPSVNVPSPYQPVPAYSSQNYHLPSSPPAPAGRSEVQPFAPPPPSPQAVQYASSYPFPARAEAPAQQSQQQYQEHVPAIANPYRPQPSHSQTQLPVSGPHPGYSAQPQGSYAVNTNYQNQASSQPRSDIPSPAYQQPAQNQHYQPPSQQQFRPSPAPVAQGPIRYMAPSSALQPGPGYQAHSVLAYPGQGAVRPAPGGYTPAPPIPPKQYTRSPSTDQGHAGYDAPQNGSYQGHPAQSLQAPPAPQTAYGGPLQYRPTYGGPPSQQNAPGAYPQTVHPAQTGYAVLTNQNQMPSAGPNLPYQPQQSTQHGLPPRQPVYNVPPQQVYGQQTIPPPTHAYGQQAPQGSYSQNSQQPPTQRPQQHAPQAYQQPQGYQQPQAHVPGGQQYAFPPGQQYYQPQQQYAPQPQGNYPAPTQQGPPGGTAYPSNTHSSPQSAAPYPPGGHSYPLQPQPAQPPSRAGSLLD